MKTALALVALIALAGCKREHPAQLTGDYLYTGSSSYTCRVPAGGMTDKPCIDPGTGWTPVDCPIFTNNPRAAIASPKAGDMMVLHMNDSGETYCYERAIK